MAAQNIPRPEDDRTSQLLIRAAAAMLAGRRRDIPQDFLADLYGHATPDDLAPYRPEELADIAEQAWSFLLERKPGAAKIGFAPARAVPGVSVLEILNDDMPFLVDSVLGELGEREPRHPAPGPSGVHGRARRSGQASSPSKERA